MAVRLTCTDNASGHDGLRWRMGPDSESVDIVVGETAPGVVELIVDSPIEPEACFSVVAYSGSDESTAAQVCAATGTEDYGSAQIGDEIGGGIYAGTNSINGSDYHIIAGKSESMIFGLRWKTSLTGTPGTQDEADGVACTNAMIAAGAENHPAAAYCVGYSGGGFDDWHMPAWNQLTLIHNNLAGHPEFGASVDGSVHTWSANERPQDVRQGRMRIVSSGTQSFIFKTDTVRWTRPIRRVLV